MNSRLASLSLSVAAACGGTNGADPVATAPDAAVARDDSDPASDSGVDATACSIRDPGEQRLRRRHVHASRARDRQDRRGHRHSHSTDAAITPGGDTMVTNMTSWMTGPQIALTANNAGDMQVYFDVQAIRDGRP